MVPLVVGCIESCGSAGSEAPRASWQLPHSAWQPPELARDGLRRALEGSCGEALGVHPMSHAPLGHVPLAGGATLFLWRYLHVSGRVDAADGVDDYAWLTREELSQRVDAPLAELAEVVCGPYE